MNLQTPQDIDLTACEREPIHIPGSIQPHGILLAIRLLRPDARLCQRQHRRDLRARSVRRPGSALRRGAADPERRNSRRSSRIRRRPGPRAICARSSCHGTGPAGLSRPRSPVRANAPFWSSRRRRSEAVSSLDALYPTLRRFVEQLQGASSIDELCRLAAEDIRRMTGFDRVLIYRFDEDWNGTVIAEDRNEVLPSYLDLRFPASDIPAQARELYRRNRLRIIPDANYTPVPDPVAGDRRAARPERFGRCAASRRCISNTCATWGRLASMSISILRDGRLWGLISCHNKDARSGSVPGAQRLRLPRARSSRCSWRPASTRRCREPDAARSRAGAAARLHGRRRSISSTGLRQAPRRAALLLPARGGGGRLRRTIAGACGQTPDEQEVKALLAEWLSSGHPEDVFSHRHACRGLPGGEGLYGPGQRPAGDLDLEAAPELRPLVPPRGGPDRQVGRRPAEARPGRGGHARLHPRTSFETWKETVRLGRSPGDRSELEAVRRAAQRHRRHRAAQGRGAGRTLPRSSAEQQGAGGLLLFGLARPARPVPPHRRLFRAAEEAGIGASCREQRQALRRHDHRVGLLRPAPWWTTCCASRRWAARRSSPGAIDMSHWSTRSGSRLTQEAERPADRLECRRPARP